MDKEENLQYKNITQDIVVICPNCGKKKKIKFPYNIIIQSNRLCAVSIPKNLICEHSFQLFVDKNFKIRGYQKIDIDLSNLEIFNSNPGNLENEKKKISINDDNKISIINELREILRTCVDNENILGSAIFTLDGKTIYSSLPMKTLYHTIREFEIRNKKKLITVKKLILILENDQKIFSNFIAYSNCFFIITLIFSKKVRLGLGDLYLKDIKKKIENLYNGRIQKQLVS
ncbi:MAG: hypothetical protein ACTSPD_21425 [Promethearchaeota archaeon]